MDNKVSFPSLNIAFHNSFVLFKKFSGSSKTYLQYLITIMESIAGESIIALTPHVSTSENLDINCIGSKKIIHFPVKLIQKKRCKCCFVNDLRKETLYSCSCCNFPLCIVPCFELWHNSD